MKYQKKPNMRASIRERNDKICEAFMFSLIVGLFMSLNGILFYMSLLAFMSDDAKICPGDYLCVICCPIILILSLIMVCKSYKDYKKAMTLNNDITVYNTFLK